MFEPRYSTRLVALPQPLGLPVVTLISTAPSVSRSPPDFTLAAVSRGHYQSGAIGWAL
jgi:hypothetical protein